MRRLPLPLGLLAAVAVLVAAPAAAEAVAVYAATSLGNTFPGIDNRPTYNFAGTDALARQIEAGAPADVFAGASPKLPDQLHADGTCSQPVTFATNVMVLVTPAGNPADIHSVYDLARGPRKKLAIGQASVPIGAYTRTLLGKLNLASILTRNTVSDEPNVGGIVSAVRLGSADAGFVYVTDWKANAKGLLETPLPAWAQPPVRYEMCLVRRTGADTAAAMRFDRKVMSPTGRTVLRRNGFGLPRMP